MNAVEKNMLMLRYTICIYEKCKDLINSGKKIQNWDNNDISKIFEYYSCIKLMIDSEETFYEYGDIDPNFKEINSLTQNDTGVDACNLVDTIVQCKLRKKNLTYGETATFFGSQNHYDTEKKQTVIKWPNLILARNSDCKLSSNLVHKQNMFTDKAYDRKDLLDFCQNLLDNKPKYPVVKGARFVKRDYQNEYIKHIVDNKENTIISLPTGTGKSVLIIFSIKSDHKYLILVPRVFLMYQLQEEIIRHRPTLKKTVQLIGDGNNKYDENKNVTICVYNSVNIVEKYCDQFERIFVDEAHHVVIPEIYANNEDGNADENEDDENENDENDDENEDDENKNDENDDDNEDENVSENENENENENEDDQNSENNDENNIDDDDEENDEENDEDNNGEKDGNEEYNSKYIDVINSLKKYNNNVYLSATIDELTGFKYYKKDIREMIDSKYLCDYVIKVPIFSDDPTNRNICEYLVKNYRNVIIYCNSSREGVEINNLMNQIMPKSSAYIDCKTTKIKRNQIIKNYKNGDTPYLVNVRVLVEGFDAPITKSVCFMHMPSKSTTLVQIMGRALRKHENKTIANIILPFSSKTDESSISIFLRIMAKNDTRIRKSYESKTLGGYISLDSIGKTVNDGEDNNVVNNLVEFRYELIYDSLAIQKKSEEKWNIRKELLFEYIDIKKSIIKSNANYKNIPLGSWFQTQKKRILDGSSEIYTILSTNAIIKADIDHYLLKNCNDKIKRTFDESLEIFLSFCTVFSRVPQFTERYNNMQVGYWYGIQKKKIKDHSCNIYKKITQNKHAKVDIDRYLLDRIKNENQIKLSDDETMDILFNLCNLNGKIPPYNCVHNGVRIGSWLLRKKYTIIDNKSELYQKLCANECVKAYIDKYLLDRNINQNQIKLSDDDMINVLFDYSDTYYKTPPSSKKCVHNGTEIGRWYERKKHKIIDNESELYQQFSANKYVKINIDNYLLGKTLFVSNDEYCVLLCEFATEHKRLPKKNEIYNTFKVGGWYLRQKCRFKKGKNKDVHEKLSENELIKKDIIRFFV